MSKITTNSVLQQAINRATKDDLYAAQQLLKDIDTQNFTAPRNGGEMLAHIAIATAGHQLVSAMMVRNMSTLAESPPQTNIEKETAEYTEAVRQLSTHSIEGMYFKTMHASLVGCAALADDETMEESEKEYHERNIRQYEIQRHELLRRGVMEDVMKRQELRNLNFNKDNANWKSGMEWQCQHYLAQIRSDQWATAINRCTRDVEAAIETGESELIERERAFLDAVRDHIAKNGLLLEVPE